MAQRTTPDPTDASERLVALLIACCMGLVVLKLGSVVIMDGQIQAPRDLGELLIQTFPLKWGLMIVGVAVLVGFGWAAVNNWIGFPRGMTRGVKILACLPALWLAWNLVSATQTVDRNLTAVTLKHFSAAIACFYLGFFVLRRIKNSSTVWLGLAIALVLVSGKGWSQHFVELEQTRRYIQENEADGWVRVAPADREDMVNKGVLLRMADGTFTVHPHVVARLEKGRIYATFEGPNSLAAGLLLLLPLSLGLIGVFRENDYVSSALALLLAGTLAVLAVACLYWSGSRAGWLIALAQAAAGIWIFAGARIPRKAAAAFAAALVVVGLCGFVWKYQENFRKGWSSVGARFDYWTAALNSAAAHPILGTGPGTFQRVYEKVLRPDQEMARLAHNDYLEQATDAGFPAFLAYSAFIMGILWWVYRESNFKASLLRWTVWLSVLGWSLHGLSNYSLYIPASAWIAFLLLGWLLGSRIPVDTPPAKA